MSSQPPVGDKPQSTSSSSSAPGSIDNPQSKDNSGKKGAFDAGHVPITEELDGAARTLPPVVPVLIAMVVIGVLVAALLYFTRPKPIASVTINKIVPVEQLTKDRVLVTMEVTLRNLSAKEIWVRGVEAKIVTPQGESNDVPAPAVDLPRYFKAYPELKQSEAPPLIDNTKIMPGAEQAGMFVVGFPVTKDAFNKRLSLEVTIHLYGQRPLVIKQ